MKVYLGSPDNALQANAARDMPVLLSFALAGRYKWITQYVPSFDRLLIDCGAYTAYSRNIDIDGAAYKAWCDRWTHVADAYAGIDDIAGDYRKSLANYEQYGGFPTFHDTDPPELLDDLIPLARERGGWIGIGLKPPREGKENFIRSTCERLPDDLHVHGWALRHYLHIRRLDSVDSTNWWRDAMDLRVLPLCKHLTYGETLEVIVKRYQRARRQVVDAPIQEELF
tara:strand:+ start:603 stop:1280 length:678 start_codon:yes stop_codon:yes gene_type:complete